jgi:hypothetical protein
MLEKTEEIVPAVDPPLLRYSSFIGKVLPSLVVISILLDPNQIKVMVILIIDGQINSMPG